MDVAFALAFSAQNASGACRHDETTARPACQLTIAVQRSINVTGYGEVTEVEVVQLALQGRAGW